MKTVWKEEWCRWLHDSRGFVVSPNGLLVTALWAAVIVDSITLVYLSTALDVQCYFVNHLWMFSYTYLCLVVEATPRPHSPLGINPVVTYICNLGMLDRLIVPFQSSWLLDLQGFKGQNDSHTSLRYFSHNLRGHIHLLVGPQKDNDCFIPSHKQFY